MKINSMKELEKYLDLRLDVDESPYDNIFLYKHFLRYDKELEHRIIENLFNIDYINEYILHMKRIGWQEPVQWCMI